MKTIVLPTFSGEDKDYVVYWPRFMVYVTLKRFNDVLGKGSNLATHPNVFIVDLDTQKNQDDTISQNKVAMASFTMLFTTDELMEHIEDVKIAELATVVQI